MLDIIVSLIVITLTGSFIALLFITISRNYTRKELEIKEYCQSSGYLFSRSDEPLRKEVSIKGNAFVLTSTLSSLYHDAQTGSDSWNKVSVWSTETHDAERPEFLLGSVSASLDWESLPSALKDTAMQRLLSEGGEGYSPEHASIIKTPANRAFLLFQKPRGSAMTAIERILPMLDKCPGESRVVIHSGESGVNVKCSNLFIRSLGDVRTLMDLGFACAGFVTI